MRPPSNPNRRELAALAFASALVTGWLVGLDPYQLETQAANTTSRFVASGLRMVWVAIQSLSILLPGLLLVRLVKPQWRGVAKQLVTAGCYLLPVTMLAEMFVRRWTGEHLLSVTMWRLATEYRQGLLEHLHAGIVLALTVLIVGAALVCGFIRWLGISLAPRNPEAHRFKHRAAPLMILGGLFAASDYVNVTPFPDASAKPHASVTPWTMIGWGREDLRHTASVESETDASFASRFRASVERRELAQRQLAVESSPPPESMPDVLIVVIESFRRGLIHPDVMPQLASFSERAIICRSHFSGGNATNHGVFSLVNGLEAIWHDRSVRYTPLLNRIFRQAGYELGFFAGHNDWRTFRMDGYISPEHYDTFETTPPRGLESDRQAVQSAAQYLDPGRRSDAASRPRLAMLYLYATHAPYLSYASDQVFEPAADQRMLIPYAHSTRDKVWNRYKNSARSIDRLLSPLLVEDRVVVVAGDHGEAFLEDGTIGHGLRISEFQNMTEAIVLVPNQARKGLSFAIDEPTMHADVLPTLVSALKIRLNRSDVFDGVDLFQQGSPHLASRAIVTRNYLNDDVAVIESLSHVTASVFGHLGRVSLSEFRLDAIGAIDKRGEMIETNRDAESAIQRWAEARFSGVLKAENSHSAGR